MSKSDALPPKLRRRVLATLARDRLSSLSGHFGLDVEDRRIVDQHIDALVRSRSVDFAEVLGMLKRSSAGWSLARPQGSPASESTT